MSVLKIHRVFLFQLRYLCLFAYSGVQHILCCVYVLFFLVYVPSFSGLSIFDCPFGILWRLYIHNGSTFKIEFRISKNSFWIGKIIFWISRNKLWINRNKFWISRNQFLICKNKFWTGNNKFWIDKNNSE
jgi:hypothetical protein